MDEHTSHAGQAELPLLESLLAVHGAPSAAWLADAASTAGERALGAQHALFFLLDGTGKLVGERPASDVHRRGLLKLEQALGIDLTAFRFDPTERPAVAAALEASGVTTVPLQEGLPVGLEASRLESAQRELGVSEAWLTPLQAGGQALGLILLLMPAEAPSSVAQAELLGRHAAVALANLIDREAARRRGELDVVRWVYDEKRYREELAQEARRAQRHDRHLSILLLRVVNLADLHSRYGRFLVERILRQVAARLSDAMRETDFLGAAGDDGFAAILVEADLEGAGRAKQRLLQGVDTISLPGVELPDLHVELSCSTASLPEDGADADELTAVAERRLFQEDVASVVLTSGETGEGEGEAGPVPGRPEPLLGRLAKKIQGKA